MHKWSVRHRGIKRYGFGLFMARGQRVSSLDDILSELLLPVQYIVEIEVHLKNPKNKHPYHIGRLLDVRSSTNCR